MRNATDLGHWRIVAVHEQTAQPQGFAVVPAPRFRVASNDGICISSRHELSAVYRSDAI